VGGLLAAGLLLGAGAVQAALSEPVDGMVYDDVLDLCWLQDASASGERSWDAAVAWAENLEFGGHDDWRLAQMSSTSPTQSITECVGTDEPACRTSGNELGYMFWHNDITTVNQGPFTNIPSLIWSGTGFSTTFAWFLNADDGSQVIDGKRSSFVGWAVRPGQCRDAPAPVAAQPVPAVSALGLGLLGLLLTVMARSRLR